MYSNLYWNKDYSIFLFFGKCDLYHFSILQEQRMNIERNSFPFNTKNSTVHNGFLTMGLCEKITDVRILLFEETMLEWEIIMAHFMYA
jgi:GTPase SAR1 family protein